MGVVGGYKGVTCNSAGTRDGVDCCRSKRKATELRLAGRSLPGSSGSLARVPLLAKQGFWEFVVRTCQFGKCSLFWTSVRNRKFGPFCSVVFAHIVAISVAILASP